MEVKPGYKLAEVGIIPQEWEARPARALGLFKGGSGFPLGDQGKLDGEYPFYKVSDMNNEGNETFMTTANHYISDQVRKRLGATVFPVDSIIFAKVGAAVFLERKKILGQASCIDNNLTAFVLDKAQVDVRYMHSLLLSKKLGDLVSTTALPALNSKQLGDMVLAIPPLSEQRAIATALCDAEALLGGLDRLIAKKRDIKQAVMQQLLSGQIRLPGYSGEWEMKRLGELVDIVSGGTPKTSDPSNWNGEIKWCTPTDITACSGKYLRETERTISRHGLNGCGARLMPAGSLLLCSRATIGEVRIAAVEVCTNQGFKALVCSPSVSSEFLYYKLLTMKPQMIERAFGSTFLEISKTNVAALEIATPSLVEQTAIATVLSDIDTELTALETRRDKTRALKHAMMQELLTGKTRLIPPGDTHV